ncbi:MAG: SDR family oxidoreductase [Porphyromonadaceae bacterium]|nr:MAG: SDR family oxidoreductase [Porphyromonadaceae bacterium]
MKILLTGATGYIGRRLLPALLENGHEVICCVRAGNRFLAEFRHPNLSTIEVDFLKTDDTSKLPIDIDVAYFLMHSMNVSTKNFENLEKCIAINFVQYINKTLAKQIIYLSGLVPSSGEMSSHLRSRWEVEKILGLCKIPATILRAGIVVGSGSASFEIIRDLSEKLPFMIAPGWLNNRCQPIAIRNVIQYLIGTLGNVACFGKTYDIGGPEILTYKEMLLGYAKVRNLKRRIITFPLVTSRLSSYWLFFITTTSYKLAANLVESMKADLICKNNDLEILLGIESISYDQAIVMAFAKIEQNLVLSSWKDALNDPALFKRMTGFIEVPKFGTFRNVQIVEIGSDSKTTLDNLWALGGETGWYYADWIWQIRGFIDRLVGGVGLRRGRTHPWQIHSGDALDFWRVLIADRSSRRLLLFAEMKVPGEAWLEFSIQEGKNGFELHQTATFRPSGITGRFYWYVLLPLHAQIFVNMAKRITWKKDTML